MLPSSIFVLFQRLACCGEFINLILFLRERCQQKIYFDLPPKLNYEKTRWVSFTLLCCAYVIEYFHGHLDFITVTALMSYIIIKRSSFSAEVELKWQNGSKLTKNVRQKYKNIYLCSWDVKWVKKTLANFFYQCPQRFESNYEGKETKMGTWTNLQDVKKTWLVSDG